MDTYRITFVNPASAPRPSYMIVVGADSADAERAFWGNVNPANVLNREIYGVERRTGNRWIPAIGAMAEGTVTR